MKKTCNETKINYSDRLEISFYDPNFRKLDWMKYKFETVFELNSTVRFLPK